jgi:preprotein translocase subunit Sec61beta
MVKLERTKSEGGPSSVMGLIRFKEGDSLFQIGPFFVVGLAIVLILVVMFLHRLF